MPATLRQMDIGFQANLYESQNPTRKWLHTTRRAWVLSKLESVTPPCARFLEVGIGCGVYTEWMARHGFVTGLDINEDFVLAANFLRHVDARVGDITQTTTYDSEFDIALCSEVIEHIVNSQAALNNMFRALKSNGLLILTTPNRFSTMEVFARLLRFKPVAALARWVYGEPVDDLGHVNRLTRAALRKQIEAAGFEVVERYDVALYLPVVAELGGSVGARVCRWGADVLRRSDILSHLLWTQCWVLKKPSVRMFDPVRWRFIGVGLINTLLGLGVIFAARRFVGEFTANVIGYLVVVPLSFIAHRAVSFRDKGNRWSAFARYLPTIAAGYLANLLTLGIGLGLTNAYVAQTAAILSHVTVTYVLSRHFVFREHECSQQK